MCTLNALIAGLTKSLLLLLQDSSTPSAVVTVSVNDTTPVIMRSSKQRERAVSVAFMINELGPNNDYLVLNFREGKSAPITCDSTLTLYVPHVHGDTTCVMALTSKGKMTCLRTCDLYT